MKLNRVVRLGVVGLIRGHCAASLIGDADVQIRAICDKNPTLLAEKRQYYTDRGVADLLCFEAYEDMLRSDIDAVYVATDKPLHTRHVIQALEAGKHVISEIPVIETVEEAKLLRDAVTAHPELKYMTGENCCYWAFIEEWKRMHEAGAFGDIVYAEAEYLHSIEPDKIKPYTTEHWRKYNPAITYLTHSLGPLLHIMNDRCVSVSCIAPESHYNPYKKGAQNGVALFRTAKGAAIRIFIGFGAYVGFDHNFALYGTKGMILTDKTKPLKEAHSFARLSSDPASFEGSMIEIPVTTSLTGETGGHGGADGKMLRDFIRCIREDTPPPLTVDDGIRMSLPGIIANESALRGGETLEIPDIL